VGASIAIGQGEGFLWDLGGPGSADVVRAGPSGLVLVRLWVDDPNPDLARSIVLDAAKRPLASATEIGHVRVDCGSLAIVWSPEPGEDALVVKLQSGTFTCLGDEFTLPGAKARRCALVRA
jgi:hypothetical protein